MKQIKVTGKGELSVAPTITEVILTIEGLEDEYYQALSNSADEANAIKAILLENGLKKEAMFPRLLKKPPLNAPNFLTSSNFIR